MVCFQYYYCFNMSICDKYVDRGRCTQFLEIFDMELQFFIRKEQNR